MIQLQKTTKMVGDIQINIRKNLKLEKEKGNLGKNLKDYGKLQNKHLNQ